MWLKYRMPRNINIFFTHPSVIFSQIIPGCQSALFPVLNVCTLMRTAAALKQKCTPEASICAFLSPSPNQKVRLLRTCLRAIRVELGLVWWHLVVKVEVCRGLHDDGGPTEVRRVAGVT